jgi:ATP-dependent RNA helicase DHX29
MAPNKKKKKTVSNPARGFATISIASKPKRDKQDTTAETAEPHGSVSTQDNASESMDELPADLVNPKELHELTPEELEERLEESELQALVEKYASDCKRQAARQASKLQTDLRLLRMSAEPLNTRKWLPPEFVEQILLLVSQDMRNGNFRPEPGNTPKLKVPRQEDLVAKLWTLKLALLALGFPQHNATGALQQVLENVSVTGDPTPASKENIWGLPQALDWLALTCERSELPDYDGRQQQDTPSETPQSSGDSTPSLGSPEKEDAVAGRYTSSIPGPTLTFQDKFLLNEAIDASGEVPEHAQSKDYSHASDQESDLEPDELITSYLSFKLQLYELQPQLVHPFSRKNNKTKLPRPSHPADEDLPTQGIKRLLNKLKKIESDVLFDQHEADAQWTKKRIEIERENKTRRKLGLQPIKIRSVTGLSLGTVGEISRAPHESKPASPNPVHECEDGSEDDDDIGILGELFTSSPETLVDPPTETPGIIMNAAKGSKVTIREFGKWTGMSPRKVLEEACKAR